MYPPPTPCAECSNPTASSSIATPPHNGVSQPPLPEPQHTAAPAPASRTKRDLLRLSNVQTQATSQPRHRHRSSQCLRVYRQPRRVRPRDPAGYLHPMALDVPLQLAALGQRHQDALRQHVLPTRHVHGAHGDGEPESETACHRSVHHHHPDNRQCESPPPQRKTSMLSTS